jgi:hypothetical protein
MHTFLLHAWPMPACQPSLISTIMRCNVNYAYGPPFGAMYVPRQGQKVLCPLFDESRAESTQGLVTAAEFALWYAC